LSCQIFTTAPRFRDFHAVKTVFDDDVRSANSFFTARRWLLGRGDVEAGAAVACMDPAGDVAGNGCCGAVCAGLLLRRLEGRLRPEKLAQRMITANDNSEAREFELPA